MLAVEGGTRVQQRARQGQRCIVYSALAGKGVRQRNRGLFGSVSARQKVSGVYHLGGRCGGLGCRFGAGPGGGMMLHFHWDA